MKNFKKVLLSLCAFSFGACLAGGFSLTAASANETYSPDFTIGNYASVRLGEKSGDVDKTGVRFKLFMSQDKYGSLSTDGVWNEGVQVGALVMPSDLLGENELTTATVDVVNIPLYADMWREATADELEKGGITGDYVTSYAVLYNVPDVCLDWELTAVGYIDPTTAENDTVYTDISCKRSMAQVALAAIQAGGDETRLDKYLPTYEVEFKQGDNVVKSALVKYGDKASLGDVEIVTKKGYFLTGWKDQNGEAYDFETPVTGDLTLTAVEESINDKLTFNKEEALNMVKSATTKAIVQDGDKKVLSATFGGKDVLKIDLGSIYKMEKDDVVGFKVYYQVAKSEASNKVEVWFNNLGGSLIWDKSATFDTVYGGEYGVLYLEADRSVINLWDHPDLIYESVLFKSNTTVSIKIEKIEFVTAWEKWDGFMAFDEGFTGAPEYVLADYTNFLAYKQNTAKVGAATMTLEQGTGLIVKKTQWAPNTIKFTFPTAQTVKELDTVYFYFRLLNETDKVFLQPFLIKKANGSLINFWQSEDAFPNGNMTQLADGTYKLKIKVSHASLAGTDQVAGFAISATDINGVPFVGVKLTATIKNPTGVGSWSKFNTQIGNTSQYLLADYTDSTWNGVVFGRGSGKVTAVRNASGSLTGFTMTGCSWAGSSVVFGFQEGIDYTTVDKIYVNYTSEKTFYAYIYDEAGNGYRADVTASNGVATVSLPAAQTATDNACKGDANVTFGMKKITGILLTFDETSDSGTITKITYTKK